MLDCHAKNNSASNIRVGGNRGANTEDLIIGCTAEVDDTPVGRQGALFQIDNGGYVEAIGLHLRAIDEYGNECIQIRSPTDEVVLDRVSAHVSGPNRVARLDGDGAQSSIEIKDCHWYDDSSSNRVAARIEDNNVTSDGSWNILADNNSEIQVTSSGNFTLRGSNVSTGTYTANQLDLDDPNPLPEYHISGLGSTPVDQTAEFTVTPERDGIEFSEIADFQAETGSSNTIEGLAYDGEHLYTGERESEATIRQWTTDGTPTGETVSLPGGHTNTLKWYDGELWVSSSDERETYVIDWGTQSIVDTINHAGVVANGAWRELKEDGSGDPMFIFPIWRSDDAYVIDAGAARSSGSTTGHVVKDLSVGFWFNPQTTDWGGDGTCYTLTHEHIIKHTLPPIDEIPEGYPLYSLDIEWFQPMGTSRTLEQLVAVGNGEFYLADRAGDGTIYHGHETHGTYDLGDLSESGDLVSTTGPFDAGVALDVTENVTSHLRFVYGPTRGTVACWFYDDMASEKRVYPAITDTEGNATNIAVATQEYPDTYATWDGDWHNTGISREEGWHRFRWTVTESNIALDIAKNGGDWQRAGTSLRAREIEGVRLQQWSGSALVGPWSLSIDRVPDSPPSSPTATGDLSIFAEDSQTGTRINGAEVSLEWLEGKPHPDDDAGPHTGTTGSSTVAEGGYDFGDLPIGYYHIEVEHDEYDTGTYDEGLWRDSGETDHEAMYLDTGGRLPIIYLDEDTEPTLQSVGTTPLSADGVYSDAPLYDPDDLTALGMAVGPHAVTQETGELGAFALEEAGGPELGFHATDGSGTIHRLRTEER
jgi:hypothetical protein